MTGSADPLLPTESQRSAKTQTLSAILVAVFFGLVRAIENILDWLPLITVQVLNGSASPVVALGWGTAAAAFVLLLAFLKTQCFKKPGAVYPKTLDLGQFLLFGFLWILALVFKNNKYIDKLLVLWFNPFTTAGIAIIMWVSILRGRAFVLEFVQAQMPPPVWARLSSKKWFINILTEAAWFWVKILVAMTAIVTIQPLLVTFLYAGEVNQMMSNLGNVLTVGQFCILFYGMRKSAKDGMRRETNKKRVREVKERGRLDDKMLKLHGPPVSVTMAVNQRTTDITTVTHHHIRSLTFPTEMDDASEVLADAFQDDESLKGFLDTKEGKLSFFSANCRAGSYFNMVLGCSEEPHSSPRCVMVCIPVLSRSQDEIDVFNSYEAWVEHGFQVPGASESDFPLPGDDLFALGQMKKKPQHGLTKQAYIYIAFFGADSQYKGRGYGRSLLKYIIEQASQSESCQNHSSPGKLPLVLETTNAFNISQYKRYGFRVVDSVEGRPEWVLMIRDP
eukprot:gnl/MRDRNA2_/MRDRNA2_133601_c0_seq1.p1 gnl/MRDRNA2_/MRDRNA2_133601_c0~~gnl/MRDRNA2_/MRDRNA2_133601_c0_seq1.p1  ORF type:complete len:505 (+),score=45.96 gnl/MRDRNA2_/MRDRNA2_133601_c0_seq1:72-1586(+)